MKFRAARDIFAESVAWVARSLPARPAVPVLGCVVLTVNENGLTISGFDYEVSAKESIAADISSYGRVLVSGRLLSDITKALPNKPVDVENYESRVSITCGSAKFSLPTMPVEDYPDMPTIPATTGTISSSTFVEAVSQVVVAAGRDDTLPMLTGVYIEIEGKTVVIAATDRFRLAVRELEWQPDSDSTTGSILVPAKTLSDAAKTIGGGVEAGISLAFGSGTNIGGDGIFGILGGGKQITTRLLDAEFPKFRQLLPVSHTAVATIDSAPLLDAIKRVSIVADRGAQIRMEFDNDAVLLTAGGDESGKAEERLSVMFHGDPLTIAFNPKYLSDGLNAIGVSKVEFGFTTPNRPAIIRPATNSDPVVDENSSYPAPDSVFSYLLMPVRLPG